MHRSKWKLPFLPLKFLYSNLIGNEKLLTNMPRNLIIPIFLYKKKVQVYNGRIFYPFSIKYAMLGKKFGEFSITKKLGPLAFKKKKLKKRK